MRRQKCCVSGAAMLSRLFAFCSLELDVSAFINVCVTNILVRLRYRIPKNMRDLAAAVPKDLVGLSDASAFAASYRCIYVVFV